MFSALRKIEFAPATTGRTRCTIKGVSAAVDWIVVTGKPAVQPSVAVVPMMYAHVTVKVEPADTVQSPLAEANTNPAAGVVKSRRNTFVTPPPIGTRLAFRIDLNAASAPAGSRARARVPELMLEALRYAVPSRPSSLSASAAVAWSRRYRASASPSERPPAETGVAGVQAVPFHVRTWPALG